MHAHHVVHHQVVFQFGVFDVVDEKAPVVARHHIVLDHRVLHRAQHDAVVGVAPGPVATHHLVAHFHQRQAAPVVVGFVVFPDVVVRRHVVRAVTAVVQLVAPKGGVVRHVHIQRIAHEADVVVQDLRTLGVVQLDTVAALGGVEIALARDEVALNAHVVDLLDPQAKQVVGQIAVLHHGAVCAREEVDTGVLVFQAAARIAHDQAFDNHVRGRDANGVASQPAIERGAVQAAQREGFVDQQVDAVVAALHLDDVARRCSGHGGLQVLPWLDSDRGSTGILRNHPAQRDSTGQAQ